jgi:hypothetical protein
MMYEVVEFRPCSGYCGNENCQDDKETVLFQHKDKPPCVHFMMLRAHEKGTKDMIVKSKEEVSYRFFCGKMLGTINMRVQECVKCGVSDEK